MGFQTPTEVSHVTSTLHKAGFEAYLVGGCVRDLAMSRTPKDWDVTTNAQPEQIQELFENTFYENDFGTVGVVNEETEDETLRVVEVTPYRIEGAYSDKRRPDSVSFEATLEDDLARRDFTINALAYNPETEELIDLYEGYKDIEERVIRAVGEADARLSEDALRSMRAIRIATELAFSIEEATGAAVKAHAADLQDIAAERIREEFSRIIASRDPMEGILLLHKYGLLAYIAPEIEEGIGVEQNGDHIYDVWEHNLRALAHSAERDWPLHVRIAALLHDVGKPKTRRWAEEKNDWTFYGHDVVGGRMAATILKRLKYPRELVDRVEKLVRWHLFFSDIDKITLSAVRRLVRNVGPENVWDLMKVRACDRIGMGRPKEKPYRLRKYESLIEEATRAPVTVGMLAITGDRIMEITGETPGPRIGFILHALLEEVLEDPDKNTAETLEEHAKKLAGMPDERLRELGEHGKEKREKEEEREISKIRERYHVK